MIVKKSRISVQDINNSMYWQLWLKNLKAAFSWTVCYSKFHIPAKTFKFQMTFWNSIGTFVVSLVCIKYHVDWWCSTVCYALSCSWLADETTIDVKQVNKTFSTYSTQQIERLTAILNCACSSWSHHVHHLFNTDNDCYHLSHLRKSHAPCRCNTSIVAFIYCSKLINHRHYCLINGIYQTKHASFRRCSSQGFAAPSYCCSNNCVCTMHMFIVIALPYPPFNFK